MKNSWRIWGLAVGVGGIMVAFLYAGIHPILGTAWLLIAAMVMELIAWCLRKKEKFVLLLDLGIVTVPEGFESNVVWRGANFSNPSQRVQVGEKFQVQAFKKVVRGETTSRECIKFLEKRVGNTLLGAQGAKLVLEQKGDKLPKGFWYESLDRKENLPEYSGGYHKDGCYRVPSVSVCLGCPLENELGYFGSSWGGNIAILSFAKVIE